MSCNRPGAGGGRRGFTLLEILIAFAIMAVALGALMQAFSTGLESSSAARDYAVATMHARSKLEEVGITIPLEAGTATGRFQDGYRWRVDIARADAEAEAAEAVPLDAYGVEVSVAWGDRRSVSLETLRLGPRE